MKTQKNTRTNTAKVAPYEAITNAILERLESGVAPWRKPWKAGTMPINAVSGKCYRGINLLALSLAPYTEHRWLTFKQAQDLGGSVRLGEKSTKIIFWNFDRKEQDDSDKKRAAPWCKPSFVFNVEQCDNLTKLKPLSEVLPSENLLTPIESAQLIADAMPNPPSLRHGGDSAHYAPTLDSVTMPQLNQFADADSYYSTLFHELGHSTGAAKRLNRAGIVEPIRFGSDKYALEELVAELCAAFVCAASGVDNSLDQSAAYVKGWASKISQDSRFLLTAAGQAQRAADYILGVKFGEQKEDSEDSAE